MAAPFAYTSVPNSLRQFVKGVPARAIPAKVDSKYLASIGLKGQNDASIITVLKFIGFLDGGGAPTNVFKSYRDKTRGPTVLAQQIRDAYKALYQTYEDAEKQSDDILRDFFSANTKVGAKAISYMIATFKVLAEFGDFTSTSKGPSLMPQDSSKPPGISEQSAKAAGPQIHINLQIHLPDSNNPATYDAIFDAIALRLSRFL